MRASIRDYVRDQRATLGELDFFQHRQSARRARDRD
jgi:hypothetical protein